MKRPPFSLSPSSTRCCQRVAFAVICFLFLAATGKSTLADSANSNDTGAVAIDSDSADPATFADADRLVRPLQVESTSGQVTNAQALVAGQQGYATLTWGGQGAAPMIILGSPPGLNFWSTSYSTYFLPNLYDYYLYTGDLDFVRQQWPSAEQELDYCT